MRPIVYYTIYDDVVYLKYDDSVYYDNYTIIRLLFHEQYLGT